MHVVLQGALIGLGIALFLVVMEYVLVYKGAKERAARWRRAVELDVTERKRISTIVRFALVLPPAFALVFFIIWG